MVSGIPIPVLIPRKAAPGSVIPIRPTQGAREHLHGYREGAQHQRHTGAHLPEHVHQRSTPSPPE